MKHKNLVKKLNSLGIKDAIADDYAWYDGNPAIVLRWNGIEEWYTGNSDPDYEKWLIETFAV